MMMERRKEGGGGDHNVVAAEALLAAVGGLVEVVELLEARNVRSVDERRNIVGVEALTDLIPIKGKTVTKRSRTRR
jgi:hypothetical protein